MAGYGKDLSYISLIMALVMILAFTQIQAMAQEAELQYNQTLNKEWNDGYTAGVVAAITDLNNQLATNQEIYIPVNTTEGIQVIRLVPG